jgi:putative flippase GtrA
VDWVDDPDSRVDIMQTAVDDIRGLIRVAGSLVKGSIPVQAIYAELGRRPMVPQSRPSFFGQVIRFGVVGAISTVAFALLYVLFQEPLGAQPANFLALLLTAVGNTAANRRFTFGMNGPDRLFTQQFQGLVVFTLAWSITSSSLLILHASAPHSSSTMELVTLTAANILATLMRFVMLRVWVFRVPRADAAAGRVVISGAQTARAS